ncbi:unnamed protein product [Rhodiola kirilowii]
MNQGKNSILTTLGATRFSLSSSFGLSLLFQVWW